MEPVLHERLPNDLWTGPGFGRLPGTAPLAPGDWLRLDEASAAQLALRDRLIATRSAEVTAARPGAQAAVEELLATVLAELQRLPGYAIRARQIGRPDGATVPLGGAPALATLGRLVPVDFCLLLPGPDGHVLDAAVLCFPASWRLAEKLGRPLDAIHGPVAAYDAALGRRVQRLFDAIRPEAPLWRVNALHYDDPALFQPRGEAEPRAEPGPDAPYVRSERQCLLRLPQSGAVVFSIQTYVVRRDALRPAEAAALAARPAGAVR